MPPKTSKLCKSFCEVLRDSSTPSILEYFLQYMESVGALHIVHFWFSVESFKNALPITQSSVRHSSAMETNGQQPWTSCHTNCESTICMTGCPTGSPVSKDKPNRSVLKRRDTENHKYCNCLVNHQHQKVTPPQSLNPASSNVIPDNTHHICEHESPIAMDRVSQIHSRLLQSKHQEYEGHSSSSLKTDAIGIYSKYLALNALEPVGITDEIRQRVEVSICPEDGNVSNTCFNESQDYIYDVMEKRYDFGFLQSSFLCKYQLDYIASGDLSLMDFLMGDNALSYFMEFMEQEGASSLLQFWLTADNFHHQLSSPGHVHDPSVDTADAISIYDRYFSLQASQPLNMEDTVRVDVENRICDEHGPRPDSYLRPQLVAFHTMNEVHFPAFVESSIYLRFLNELVHHEDDPALLQTKSQQEVNDSDQDKNTMTQVTVSVSKLSHILGKDVDDPDSLWERPQLLFRLGYINDYGEYISEIDLIPIKSSKKDFSISARIVRKQRKEEELAMKITRNIIKEVINSLT